MNDDVEILFKKFEDMYWQWKEFSAEQDAREAERLSDQMKLLLGGRFYELSSICRKLREIQKWLDSLETNDDWEPKSRSVQEELGIK